MIGTDVFSSAYLPYQGVNTLYSAMSPVSAMQANLLQAQEAQFFNRIDAKIASLNPQKNNGNDSNNKADNKADKKTTTATSTETNPISQISKGVDVGSAVVIDKSQVKAYRRSAEFGETVKANTRFAPKSADKLAIAQDKVVKAQENVTWAEQNVENAKPNAKAELKQAKAELKQAEKLYDARATKTQADLLSGAKAESNFYKELSKLAKKSEGNITKEELDALTKKFPQFADRMARLLELHPEGIVKADLVKFAEGGLKTAKDGVKAISRTAPKTVIAPNAGAMAKTGACLKGALKGLWRKATWWISAGIEVYDGVKVANKHGMASKQFARHTSTAVPAFAAAAGAGAVGAKAGAAIGASIGAFFFGVGAPIGGAIGAVCGFIGGAIAGGVAYMATKKTGEVAFDAAFGAPKEEIV